MGSVAVRLVAVVGAFCLFAVACVGIRDVSLADLNRNQQRWDGAQVRTEGVVASFDDPLHYWIEDGVPNRVELVGVAGISSMVGQRVRVEGRFTFSDDRGRVIQVETLDVLGPPR